MHDGEMAVVDFKQTNKPKRREWIDDYFMQLGAYGMAHDYVYKTAIKKGVIMMVNPDNYYQEFIVEGSEFRKYKHEFIKRVNEYYDDYVFSKD
jgi:genome maintenance exonuclease 1